MDRVECVVIGAGVIGLAVARRLAQQRREVIVLEEAEGIREGIGRTVVRNLKVMARMGTFLEDAVHRQYPGFPTRSGVLSWEDYLPPLSETLLHLLERYDSSSATLAAAH